MTKFYYKKDTIYYRDDKIHSFSPFIQKIKTYSRKSSKISKHSKQSSHEENTESTQDRRKHENKPNSIPDVIKMEIIETKKSRLLCLFNI